MEKGHSTKIRTSILAAMILAAPAAGHGALPFLRSEVSARVSGIGGASAALPEDGGAMYFNPAGLSYASQSRAAFSTWNGSGVNNRFTFLSGIFKAGRLGALDVTYLKFNSDSSDFLDLDSGRGPAAVEEDYALGLGWGHKLLKNLSLGGQVKMVYKEVGETRQGTTSAVDAGVMSVGADGNYSAGAGVRNAGGKELMSVNGTDYRPRTLYLGGAGRFPLPTGKLAAALDIEKPSYHTGADFRLGLEYSLDGFALRGGMKHEDNSTVFTAGAGARVGRFEMDYGYEPPAKPDRAVHKFTINVFFGGDTGKAAEAAQPS